LEKANLVEALRKLGVAEGEALATFFDEAPFGIYVDHPSDGCVFASQALLGYFGISWEEFQGFNWASRIFEDDIASFQEAVHRYEHELHVFDEQYRIHRPDKSTRWMHAQVRPLLGSAGQHIGSLGLIHDITESREFAEQVAHHQALAAAGQLAGRVAHDFNNLLSVVQSSVDLMERVSEEEQAPLRATIREAVEHSVQITKQLLTLSGQRSMERSAEVLDTELAKIAPLLDRVSGEGVAIGYSLEAPDEVVRLSKSQVGQVVVNLVSNARDAMGGRGQLQISTKVVGNNLHFTVEDDGCGMDTETLENLHKPFFTTKDPDRGTGLGMSIVDELVATATGTLRVESELGKGTQVTLELPILAHTTKKQVADGSQKSARGNGEWILLVDDNTALRQSLAVSLSMYGYRVDVAADLAEARAQLQRKKPAILVTDILLHDGEGTSLAAELHQTNPEIPVVFVTGFAGEHMPEIEPGANRRLLFKPFGVDRLLQDIGELLR
tara:strand:+ start:130748 stop:132238 length:1491 start_codon:yes stop_codon:yes gene_type:complete